MTKNEYKARRRRNSVSSFKKEYHLKITFNHNFKSVDWFIPYDHLFQISHVRQI